MSLRWSICLASQEVLVIDLSLIVSKLGFLTLWKVLEEYLTLLNLEFLLLQWDNIDMDLS